MAIIWELTSTSFYFYIKSIAEKYDDRYFKWYDVDVPQQCKFVTPPPSLLSTVHCQKGIACKLTHSVATTETYASSDGFNWGAKVSSKLSLFEKVFEVGGEASYGQSYTCSYTAAKTTTNTLDCSVADSGSSKSLQLYNVQSNVKCWIGKVRMNRETRNGKDHAVVHQNVLLDNNFPLEDYLTLMKSKAIDFMNNEEDPFAMIVDMDKIPEYLLHKLKKLVPDYNPYTDLIYSGSTALVFYFFGKPFLHDGYDKVVPFTNEQGNAVFQYACILA